MVQMFIKTSVIGLIILLSSTSFCYADQSNPLNERLHAVDKLIIKEKWKEASRNLLDLNKRYPHNEGVQKRIQKIAKIAEIQGYLDQPDTLNSEYGKVIEGARKSKRHRFTLGESLMILGALAGVGIGATAALTGDSSSSGTLLLITGSVCGNGHIKVKNLDNHTEENLECCGWGNLGSKTYTLYKGAYELSYAIKGCSGEYHSYKGVKFTIYPAQKTELHLNFDSGSYNRHYRK